MNKDTARLNGLAVGRKSMDLVLWHSTHVCSMTLMRNCSRFPGWSLETDVITEIRQRSNRHRLPDTSKKMCEVGRHEALSGGVRERPGQHLAHRSCDQAVQVLSAPEGKFPHLTLSQ